MLELKVLDDSNEVVLKFEHSLLSLSKWESKYKKPFLRREPMNPQELFDYFRMMLVSPEDEGDLVYNLSPKQMEELAEYINDKRTASSIPETGKKQINNEQITSELIYFWLVQAKIPFHPVETWHLSRLMMLVQVTGYKLQPPEKRKEAEIMNDWRAENERRLKLYNTPG